MALCPSNQTDPIDCFVRKDNNLVLSGISRRSQNPHVMFAQELFLRIIQSETSDKARWHDFRIE